ncbi:hypothetical protein ACT7CZ_22320 [Bacillus cereus]
MFVEHKGSLEDTLIEMEQDLQSSISYAGGTKIRLHSYCRLCSREKLYFQR